MGRSDATARRSSGVASRNGFSRRPVFPIAELIHRPTLCLRCSPPESDYVSHFDLPSRRLVALDRQHVVLMAGGIRVGGRLGATALFARLPDSGCIRMPV